MTARKPWDHGGKSRHQRGYGRAHEVMRERLMREVVLCEECARQGRTRAGSIADHIAPKSKGGTDERSNYQLLCVDCHDEKTLAEQGKRRILRPRFGTDGWPADD